MEVNRILQGDVLAELKKLPDNLVDTIVTSPPYWGLRDYGIEGQIGLEPTLEEYIYRLLTITKELKRVLKPTGVMFWNHGDCYGGSGCGKGDFREEISLSKPKHYTNKPNPQLQLIAKCLALQNYRLILRMIDEQGWILRNTIIWDKPNHMLSSVKDRFANSYEPVFMLVKQQKYWFDLDAVRKPLEAKGYESFNRRVRDVKLGKIKSSQYKASKEEIKRYKNNKDARGNNQGGPGSFAVFKSDNPCFTNPAGKNPGDLWTIPTQPFPEAHFATFPEKLIEPMILAGCPEWLCKKCGKARVRITETEYVPHRKAKNLSQTRAKSIGPQHCAMDSQGKVCLSEHQTLGWTDCKCKAGFRQGIAFDPFIGSGTVGVVAKSLGRQYLGIELSPDYIKLAERRLLNTMGRLL